MPRAHSPPRRSSRAKPTSSAQPPSQSSSSTTSSVSARNDRSTRSIGKHENSATPQSRNSEEASSQQRSTTLGSGSVAAASASAPTITTDLLPSTRRSGRRAQEDSRKDTTDMPHDEDEIIEDEETTRCVCGFQDYPGPPVEVSTTTITTSTTITATTTTTLPSSSFSSHRGSKAGLAPPSDPDTQTEEPGSLFIQCDTCEVWQHGGCVGIMTESATPENYFCEQCRPEFHRLMKTLTGQKYSRYLPIVTKTTKSAHRKPSMSKDWETRTAAERAFRNIETTKRRSTMNSRAAYDEDEVLRKVLEESKVDGRGNPSEAGTSRKGKRAREESEDLRSDIKRQRTNSNEGSPSPSNAESIGENSEHPDDPRKRQAPRGAAARSQRERELRDRERERAEAANKRKGRAERRRADDADVLEESSETPNATVTNDDNTTPFPQEVPTINEPSVSTTNHIVKRGPRPGAKRGRGGRAGLSSRDDASSPASGTKNGKEASASPGLGSGADSSGTGAVHVPSRRGRPGHGVNGNGGSGGVAREPTMVELKKRASLMLEIIAQSQMEMVRVEGRGLAPNKDALMEESPDDMAPAANLAGELATRLVKWQQEFTLEATVMTDTGSAKG